uniref:DNA-directed DNA polymerase n=1 Tax=Melicertus latisulcatus pemonivirus TaxID=2984278 RepID=A0A9C7C652_9VIRU|nr:MAG: wsv514-like protein [Melicertus latisulcatus pemonivirus]
MEPVPTFHTRIGSLDPSSGVATLYGSDDQCEATLSTKDDLVQLGHLTAAEDCVVPLFRQLDELTLDATNREIAVTNSSSGELIRISCPSKVVGRPSDFIDRIHRSNVAQQRSRWSRPSPEDSPATILSTVGMKLQTTHGGVNVTYNDTGHTTFNPYNSSPVSFEVHRDMDLLVLMAAFLKHNGVWGGSTALMSLSRFDYVGAFFDHSWGGPLNGGTSVADGDATVYDFSKEMHQFSSAFEKLEDDLRTISKDVSAAKRPRLSGELPTRNTISKKTASHRCSHRQDMYLNLGSCENYTCVACFCRLFFPVPFEVSMSPKGAAEAQERIDGWYKRGLEKIEAMPEEKNVDSPLAQLVSLTRETLGPLGEGRGWNWPPESDGNLRYEYVTHSLSTVFNALNNITRLSEANGGESLSAMHIDPSILYVLMNPLGRMVMLMLDNSCSQVTPDNSGCSLSAGKYFSVRTTIGRNVWSFQITSSEEVAIPARQAGCLETRCELPRDVADSECPRRIVYRAFCRGESLSSAGEVISDVAQSVASLNLLLANRMFSVDSTSGTISSSAVVTEPFVSLEVTGYQPVRAPNTKNAGRVTGRMLRLLRTRVGGRVWYSKEHEALLLEDLSSGREASMAATDRAASSHRVFYYDIETTGLNPLDKDALITVICGSLSTGGRINESERTIFGLATDTGTPQLLVQAVAECYGQGTDDRNHRDVHVTETMPSHVRAFSTEIDLLIGWGEFMHERRPHMTCGWNSSGFDDLYVFARVLYHLTEPQRSAAPPPVQRLTQSGRLRESTPTQRINLARGFGGMLNLTAFVNSETGYLYRKHATLLNSLVVDHLEAKPFPSKTGQRYSKNVAPYNLTAAQMIGALSSTLSLDMMVACSKAYQDQLSEFTLNAMMVKVSKDGRHRALLKDPIDVKYHLLEYPDRTPLEQAKVLRYCSKDAHLVAIVSGSINKEGEIFQLSEASGLSEATVVDHLPRPLCIIEGALYQAMGPSRTARRGCGIRRHSLATDTKGGMVSQPLIEQTPLQTVDLSSLYPSIMVQYNLCTTSFATQAQVMALRNRLVYDIMMRDDPNARKPTLDTMDRANAMLLELYRPTDIVVESWKACRSQTASSDNRTLPTPTRLERELDFRWYDDDATKECRGRPHWAGNQSPNSALRAGGLDYFPEVECSEKLQKVAFANDDTHISPSGSLEYLVTVLPLLALACPRLAAHVTAGRCQNWKGLMVMLEEDFDPETDRARLALHGKEAIVGGSEDSDEYGIHDLITRRIRQLDDTFFLQPEGFNVMVDLCERISRRVNAYDSASDPSVVKWANRLLNVGVYCRTWNAVRDLVPGVVPDLQLHYRARRVEMKNAVKKYSKTDPILAERNSVAEKVTKVFMNSKYGVLAVRSTTQLEATETNWREAVSVRQVEKGNAVGGVGGGTRHMPMANQITQIARRVFCNIITSLQQLLPGVKQVYGDTDSTFLVHNIPGDGDRIVRNPVTGRSCILVDLHLKMKLARLIPLLINCSTKGIVFDRKTAGGKRMMNIEHERITLMSHLFAKKTYHMLHFREGSPAFDELASVAATAAQPDFDIDVNPYSDARFKGVVAAVPAEDWFSSYVVPHNPRLIFRLAEGVGEAAGRLRDLLREINAHQNADALARWLTSSKVWTAFDLKALRNYYASQMVDAENGWIDSSTARRLEDEEEIERVRLTADLFVLYRKGAFVKKGIIPATKLKNLQAVFDRADMAAGLKDDSSYVESMKEHAQNCASFESSPNLAISTARVCTLRPGYQTLPNPAARAINNHLNRSNVISTNQKFVCVGAVSGWALSLNDYMAAEIPPGYYMASSVRWDPDRMRGLVASSAVRNLSVVANVVKILYDMVDADKKVLGHMQKAGEEFLKQIKEGNTAGLACLPDALSYSTFTHVSDVIARAILSIAAKKKKEKKKEEEEELESNDDEKVKEEERALIRSGSGRLCDRRVIRQMEVIATQLGAAADILAKPRSNSQRKHSSSRNKLESLIAAASISPRELLCVVADRMIAHLRSCPAIRPDGWSESEMAIDLSTVLRLLGGLDKCTDTCIAACCQALDFVLLYCVMLKMENNRRHTGQEEKLLFADIFPEEPELARQAQLFTKMCRDDLFVRSTFGQRYNENTDTVVFLFESPPKADPISKMKASQIILAATHVESPIFKSEETGSIWNSENDNSKHFMGTLRSVEEQNIHASLTSTEVSLPFFTGVYHCPVINVVAGALLAVTLNRSSGQKKI